MAANKKKRSRDTTVTQTKVYTDTLALCRTVVAMRGQKAAEPAESLVDFIDGILRPEVAAGYEKLLKKALEQPL
jgi:hypothetical protein